jgi:hypothetical protein
MKINSFAAFILLVASGSTFAASFLPEVIIRSRPGLMANSVDESNTSTTISAEDQSEDAPESLPEAEEVSE